VVEPPKPLAKIDKPEKIQAGLTDADWNRLKGITISNPQQMATTGVDVKYTRSVTPSTVPGYKYNIAMK
jgi:hypothetical protein